MPGAIPEWLPAIEGEFKKSWSGASMKAHYRTGNGRITFEIEGGTHRNGRVIDASSAIVPNARVVLISEARGTGYLKRGGSVMLKHDASSPRVQIEIQLRRLCGPPVEDCAQ
jgi:hypothetical protein